MIELVKLFIEKPALAIITMLGVLCLYTTLGLFAMQTAVAGLTERTSSFSITEERVYNMSESLGRIEAHLEQIRKAHKK